MDRGTRRYYEQKVKNLESQVELLRAEVSALKRQDEVHMKTRRTLVKRLERWQEVGQQVNDSLDAIILQCGKGTMPKGWLASANALRRLLAASGRQE